jgi:hypothetical protein
MPLQNLDRCGFARSVRAKERKNLATHHMQGDAPHRLDSVVRHAQTGDLDHGLCCAKRRLRCS